MSASDAGRVLVVGAGIVGVCTALQLRRAGWETTLVDRQTPGTACSYGNAGIVASDVVPPVAAPGVLRKVPGYLLQRDAPLAIRWSYLPRLMPWLVHFLRASRPDAFERNTRALATLLAGARRAYEPLIAEAGAEALLRVTGALQVFETADAFDGARRDADFRRGLGATIDELAGHEIAQHASDMAPIFVGALYRPDIGYIRDPLALTTALHQRFLDLGGRSLGFEVARLEAAADGGWSAIGRDAAGAEGALRADRLVVAGGAWSTRLLHGLGLRIPLDCERGYHVMLPQAKPDLRLPVSSGEGAFYLTPMEQGLRIAGTVEMGGLERAPDPRRCEAMLRRARRFLPGLPEGEAQTWMGFRPSMPDSLPVIGPVAARPGLFLAFGHGHLGLSLAAITGRLVAQAVGGEAPAVDLAPFRHDRF